MIKDAVAIDALLSGTCLPIILSLPAVVGETGKRIWDTCKGRIKIYKSGNELIITRFVQMAYGAGCSNF